MNVTEHGVIVANRSDLPIPDANDSYQSGHWRRIGVSHPCVIKQGDIYRMFFSGKGSPSDLWPEDEVWSLGEARSASLTGGWAISNDDETFLEPDDLNGGWLGGSVLASQYFIDPVETTTRILFQTAASDGDVFGWVHDVSIQYIEDKFAEHEELLVDPSIEGDTPKHLTDSQIKQWMDSVNALIEEVEENASGKIGTLCLLGFEPTEAHQEELKVLPNDGSSVLIAEYPELYNAWGGAIYGAPDADHMYMPDDRGLHYRVRDNGAGVDPDAADRTDRGDGTTGDAVGTLQGDAIRNIYGEWKFAQNNQSASGVFSTISDAGADTNYWANLSGKKAIFDASTVVPTGGDNRGINRYIWAGTYYR